MSVAQGVEMKEHLERMGRERVTCEVVMLVLRRLLADEAVTSAPEWRDE